MSINLNTFQRILSVLNYPQVFRGVYTKSRPIRPPVSVNCVQLVDIIMSMCVCVCVFFKLYNRFSVYSYTLKQKDTYYNLDFIRLWWEYTTKMYI